MPTDFMIGEMQISNEVRFAPNSVIYDGAVSADGDLTVRVNNFFYDLAGTKGKFTGAINQAVTNNATNYVYLNSSGTLVINTTGYPAATVLHIRLARVIAAGGVITQVILERVFFAASLSPTSSVITVKDEGTALTPDKSKINIVGPGITASTNGGDANQADITVATATPVSVGTANSEGTANSLARSDHVHKGSLTQTAEAEITADTTTTSTSFVDLLTISITTGVGFLLLFFNCCGDNSSAGKYVVFRITVDGTPVAATGFTTGVAGLPNPAGMQARVAVTAAAHTVKVQWYTNANTARIRPVTNPDWDHASLIAEEVTV